jgi:Domain of unknown function (DUF4331)
MRLILKNYSSISPCVLGFLTLTALACSDDPKPAVITPTDGGMVTTPDGSPPPPPPPPGSRPECVTYCDAATTACTGVNQQYKDNADCLSYCNASNWPKGTDGEQAGNTVACRIYHAGVAKMDPGTHCGHAGPSGENVCGNVAFRNDAVPTYVRVDRMGMPAVATALIAAADKNAYNDGNPENDSAAFTGKFVASLTGIHTALDADLTAKGLVPCSMTTVLANGLPECVGQEYAPGKTVASLILPYDTLSLDFTVASGFPNGRMLADPVIDVTLGVLLLKLGATQTAATLAKIPLNPGKNDINGGVFGTDFPYFLPAQQ